jgi:hypothetical protein
MHITDDSKFTTKLMQPFQNGKRMLIAAALLLLAIAPNTIGHVTRDMMLDAYFQVSVFVAATLLLFYGSERVFKIDIAQVMQSARWGQVPMAALFGTTPGCGGAVIVVAAYSSGHVSFGSVVAALTATMGDAAFLLIATRPDAAMVVLPLSFAVGIITGWIVDGINYQPAASSQSSGLKIPAINQLRKRDLAFLALAIPGFGIGVLQLVQSPLYDAIPQAALMTIGLTGTGVGLTIWALSPIQAMTNSTDTPVTRMAEETSFISVWVIGAYLAYEYLVTFAGLDLQGLFQSAAPYLPLIAVLIGFIPGCGPQVLVTTLFINGLVPFAALLGNAISNDGDALFPAIALNPKAALAATVVSAIPAMLMAYGLYFMAPSFMN